MAEITGKQAKVIYAGGQVAALDEWSVDTDASMHDVTTFSTGTVQWRQQIVGLSGWTASAAGNFDVASTGLDDMRVATLTPATGTFNFFMDKVGGEAFNGSGFIQTMSHSAPIDGVVEVDFSIQGTDALTYTTTT